MGTQIDGRATRRHLPDTPMQHALTVWSERYGAQAATEGWSVFETSRGEAAEHALVDGRPYGHRPLELERDDEAALFVDDMAVWTHVWQRASAMDACAFEAMVLLKTYAPNEYAAIARHNGVAV